VDEEDGDELDEDAAAEEEEEELKHDPKKLAQLAKRGMKLDLKDGVAAAKPKKPAAGKGKAAAKAPAASKGKGKAKAK
jgi:hypothetical protein